MGGTGTRIERHIRNQGILSPSLSLFPKHPISTFSYLSISLSTSVDSFPSFSVQNVGRHGLIQPVCGKWQLSPSTNFKFSGERLQWVSHLPRSIHPGPWGRGNKLQMWLPDPPLRLREVLRGGRSQARLQQQSAWKPLWTFLEEGGRV